MTGLVVHRQPRGRGPRSKKTKQLKQLLGRQQAEERQQRLEARRPQAKTVAPTEAVA